MESRIWGDKDSIRDLQEGLWDELERAFDDIFDKAKEEAEKDLRDYKEEQVHKQIEAISKQIAAYEKESQARQDLIQDLIDRKEEEKKAWQDHYEALKEQYRDQIAALEQEKKLAEERKKQAEKQYDDWMDTWKDIQKSIETPARDLSEILRVWAAIHRRPATRQTCCVTQLQCQQQHLQY